MYHGFIFPNTNCNDLNPEILRLIDASQIPQQVLEKKFKSQPKASFGFGDVNVRYFKKYSPSAIR
jgi:hypothetical protein